MRACQWGTVETDWCPIASHDVQLYSVMNDNRMKVTFAHMPYKFCNKNDICDISTVNGHEC